MDSDNFKTILLDPLQKKINEFNFTINISQQVGGNVNYQHKYLKYRKKYLEARLKVNLVG